MQEYVFRPDDPKDTLINDYCGAIRRMFWIRNDQDRYLAFSCLELVPREFGQPDIVLEEMSERIGTTGRVYVHGRIDSMNPTGALAWYEECIKGEVEYPVSDEAMNHKLLHGPLLQEPIWPRLICSSHEGWMKTTWNSPRVSYLIQEYFSDEARLVLDNVGVITGIIKNMSGLELSPYPELLGSIILVAPNPVFRAVHRRLAPGTDGEESEYILLQARSNLPSCELRAIIEDHRPSGVDHLIVPGIKCGIPFAIRHTEQVERSALSILDSKRGTLFWSQPHYYIRGIHIDFNVSGSKRIVRYGPSGRRHKGGEQKVETVDDVNPIDIGGDSRKSSAVSILEAGARERSNASLIVAQKWFREDREAAERFIQGIVREAKRTVILLDNYISDRELRMFGLACKRRNVDVCLLTSTETAKDISRSGSGKSNADEMLQTLSQIDENPESYKITVRVMKGYFTGIHDRFIMVDDEVWMIGPSLNEFGIRGGLAIQLPDPDPIISEILREMNDDRSDLLSEWMSTKLDEEE